MKKKVDKENGSVSINFNMADESVDPNKLIAQTQTSSKHENIKKRRIFKVSTFHH